MKKYNMKVLSLITGISDEGIFETKKEAVQFYCNKWSLPVDKVNVISTKRVLD